MSIRSFDWPTQKLQWRSPESAEARIGALTADQEAVAAVDLGYGGVGEGESYEAVDPR